MKKKKILIFLVCIIIVFILSGFAIVEATGEDNIYEALKVLIKGNTDKITSLENEVAMLKNEISTLKDTQNNEKSTEDVYNEIEVEATKIVSSKENNKTYKKQINTYLEEINNLKKDIDELQENDNTQTGRIEQLKSDIQQKYDELQKLIEENKTDIENKADKTIINIADIKGIWERKINDKAYEYYMFLDNGTWYKYGFYYSGDIITSQKYTYSIHKDNLGDSIEIDGGALNYKNNKLYYNETPICRISNITNLEIIEKWNQINSYLSIGQEKHIKQPYNKSKEIAKEILNKGYIQQDSYNLLINLIENKMDNTEYYTFINSDDINIKIEDYVKKVEFTNNDWGNYITVHGNDNYITAVSLYEVESNIPFVNINFTNNYNPRIKGSAKLSKGISDYKGMIKIDEISGLNNNNVNYVILKNYTIDGYAYVVDREKYINNTNYVITSGSIESFEFEYISYADYVSNKISEYIISEEN